MSRGGVVEGQRRMFAWIEGLPDQLAASGASDGLADVRPLTGPCHRILCCGMGGSSVAAGLLADGWPGLEAPLLVWREHGLPAWADAGTLVIACSHSGETAETLSAAAEAHRRGCPFAAVGSGGRLLAMAGSKLAAIRLPGGQPPRTALGASLGALLHLLHRLGFLPDPTASIEAAVAHLAGGVFGLLDGRPATEARARTLAKDMAGRFSVIYTAGLSIHGVGRRWLAQINENAKAAGHHACFPELTHNEIVGWNLEDSQRDRFHLTVLQDAALDPAEVRRLEAATGLLSGQFAGLARMTAEGPDHLARVLGLIVFGDLVSAHLAVATDVDPVPIARIDELKAIMGGF